MKVIGPDRYKLSFNPKRFTVSCSNGATKFSGLATSRLPKLYVVAVNEWPIYVGTTKQSMRSRLRLGWNAKGDAGYYGYDWRHKFKEATLDIWGFEGAPDEDFIETIEAEVVFLIRCSGQWPPGQTEIHFHQSETVHRDIAATIMRRYVTRPYLDR